MRSGFFNSVNQDRLYDAGFFAEYFASFIGNGIFPNPSNNLQVMANNDMSVTVNPGKAWIDGYILFNDTDYVFDIDVADGVLNRIDRIVARMDVANREITVQVKKGEFASNPVPKNLQRDADAYEIALADVYVGRGVISIAQSAVTDTRLNNDLCGIVHGVVEQVDTTTLFNQYQSWIEQEKLRFENDVDDWLANEQLDFETWEQQQKSQFDMWFSNIQDILDGNVAANLQNQITQLEEDLGNIDAPSTQEFESLQSDFSAHQADIASQEVGKGADIIGLPDPNNLFTSTNVGGAMQELFTNVSDGKALVGGAITGVDSNIVIPAEPSFNDLATGISEISTGKKWVRGSVQIEELPRDYRSYEFNIQGLDFQPSIILLRNIDALAVYDEGSIYRRTSGLQQMSIGKLLPEGNGFVFEIFFVNASAASQIMDYLAFE